MKKVLAIGKIVVTLSTVLAIWYLWIAAPISFWQFAYSLVGSLFLTWIMHFVWRD